MQCRSHSVPRCKCAGGGCYAVAKVFRTVATTTHMSLLALRKAEFGGILWGLSCRNRPIIV